MAADQYSATMSRGIQALVLIGLGMSLWGGGALLVQPDLRLRAGISLATGLGLMVLSLLGWLRSRPQDQLEVQPLTWTVERISPEHLRIRTRFVAHNRNPLLEVTLAQVTPELHLLSRSSIASIHTRLALRSDHEDLPPRKDNYWQAYILTPQSQTHLEVDLELQGDLLEDLQSCWLELHYIQYGRQLRTPKTSHLIIPLREVSPLEDPQWRQRDQVSFLPIPTHLLTPIDNLVEVIERYIKPFAQTGDVVALSETAVAVVQGNFRHPTTVHPGWLARRLCYFFPSKTSLSSSYGLQTLIDSSSAQRVLAAFLLGSAAKVLGISGVFYQYAGEQSSLIDDVTGTLPPYDQFIVLGPKQPQQLVESLQQATGLAIAIVDANDLGEVNILAATPDTPRERVVEALKINPAGNSAEQTPVVLIRPQ
jgi:hypothetical protein